MFAGSGPCPGALGCQARVCSWQHPGYRGILVAVEQTGTICSAASSGAVRLTAHARPRQHGRGLPRLPYRAQAGRRGEDPHPRHAHQCLEALPAGMPPCRPGAPRRMWSRCWRASHWAPMPTWCWSWWPGEDLDKHLQPGEGPAGQPRYPPLVRRVAVFLGHGRHRRTDLIYRDIKPENLLLGPRPAWSRSPTSASRRYWGGGP